MLKIRKAQPADAETIVALITCLAEYERAADKVKISAADILEHGFGEQPYFGCLLAEWQGKVAGFALYFFQYSTWEGRPALYLEDLFVLPEQRQKGIGMALMRKLARIALENRCTRFQWQVLDWNTPAIEFYHSLGAANMEEWYTYRMETPAIEALAAGEG